MDRVTKQDIVLYALHLLGGWEKRVHTEDIALKSFDLAPSEFSWMKHPDLPKLSAARHALEHVKEAKRGTLVDGESEEGKGVGGWMLTPEGVQWVRENEQRIERSLSGHFPGTRLPRHRRLRELLQSAAFKKFTEHGQQAEVSHAELAESLVCTVNTSAEILNDRLLQLEATAEQLQREDVRQYVRYARKTLASML